MPWSTHNPFTVLMNCLMFKCGWCVYLYVHFWIWIQITVIKRIYFWRFSYPTCNYSLWILVLFPWHVCHIVKYVSLRGISIIVNETFVHMDTHLSIRWVSSSQWQEFHVYSLVWYQKRHRARDMKLMLCVLCS